MFGLVNANRLFRSSGSAVRLLLSEGEFGGSADFLLPAPDEGVVGGSRCTTAATVEGVECTNVPAVVEVPWYQMHPQTTATARQMSGHEL